MQIEVDWTVAITSALGIAGTLIGTTLSPWFALSKDRRLRQDELDRSARYLAIRVICKLDPFVSECCNVMNDDGQADQDGESIPTVNAPTITLPEDVDWKSINSDLMYRTLGFPNEVDIARQTINFISNEVAFAPDYDDYFEARKIEYGRVGLTALALATDIRKAYKIAERDFGRWHPKVTLENAIAKANDARERTREAQAESFENMTK